MTTSDIEYAVDGTTMITRLDALWQDPERIRALAGAGLEVLRAEPRTDASKIAAIGYCFALAFEDEMRAGGVDWRMTLYGGVVHSFTHPWADVLQLPGLKYDRVADERSWRSMLDLFDEVFA